jgi:hypothetical protein
VAPQLVQIPDFECIQSLCLSHDPNPRK